MIRLIFIRQAVGRQGSRRVGSRALATAVPSLLRSSRNGAPGWSFVLLGAGLASFASPNLFGKAHLDAGSGAPVKEASTGILFPQLCNGFYLAGCGVRIKYAFVKVYAVGTYLDPLAMSAVKKSGPAAIEEALLDPSYPRTIRIVMNRALSVDKFTAAIVEALEPRMMGQDLESLEEFKKLNPPVDLVQGAEIEMTIRGDTLLYRNAVGGVGTIKSAVFTKAMCDVYYGGDPVSPTHKASVIEGTPKL